MWFAVSVVKENQGLNAKLRKKYPEECSCLALVIIPRRYQYKVYIGFGTCCL